ncbi:hypothetical protein HAX54_026514 [Datura stramonium]|uniref:AP2/ERF domain-containing protein n=1 Tax=Datura stramonium TaxID=4076 RepID=A0ABS8S7W3_DATST|nr:hypothetical protein [Datura stramonium]
MKKVTKFKGRKRSNSSISTKFIGVRQRSSGKWIAEIKDTTHKKIRMWLGTFETAEDAARAYDEAACLLRGSNTRTNFVTTRVSADSQLAYRIRNLLDSKKIVKQNKQGNSVVFGSTLSWGFEFAQELLGFPILDESTGEMGYTEFERMKVERQISASLYAVNGVQEYMENVDDPAADLSLWDLPPLCSLFS